MVIAYALMQGRSEDALPDLSPSSWLIILALLGVWLFVLAGQAEVPNS